MTQALGMRSVGMGVKGDVIEIYRGSGLNAACKTPRAVGFDPWKIHTPTPDAPVPTTHGNRNIHTPGKVRFPGGFPKRKLRLHIGTRCVFTSN
jgi:hypothetical protein